MTRNDIAVPVALTDEATIPTYARADDAGADLRTTQAITLAPFQRALVPTGVRVEIPSGYVGLITPRSGNAFRHGLSIVNSPGVIDAGYRGELKVCLLNTDATHPIEISVGDRIAQLLILPVMRANFTTVSELSPSERGSGGYGSSGTLERD